MSNFPRIQTVHERVNLDMFIKTSLVCNILILSLLWFTEQSMVTFSVVAGCALTMIISNIIVKHVEKSVISTVWKNDFELASNLYKLPMSASTRWELTVRIPGYFRLLNIMAGVYCGVSILGTFVLSVCTFDHIPLFSLYYATASAYAVGVPVFMILMKSNKAVPVTV